MDKKPRPLRAAAYIAATSDGRNVEAQRRGLRRIARRKGWDVVEVYIEQRDKGADTNGGRPALDRLRRDAVVNRFDLAMVWSADRLAGSMKELVSLLGDLHQHRIDLYFHEQDIDTTTQSGRALFPMMRVFAQLEQAMRRERIVAGQARARMAGRRLGRPPGTTTSRRKKQDEVLELRAAGYSIRKIAKSLSIAPGTVHSILRKS